MSDTAQTIPDPTPTTVRKLSLAVWIIVLLLHAVIVFEVLPPNLFIKYQVAARQLLDGGLATERLVDFSPLYLKIHCIAETYTDNPGRNILCLQILLSALSALFLFRLLMHFFTLPVSLLGTFLFATNSSIILYTGTFEPEPLIIFSILGFLTCSLHCRSVNAFFAGVFLGLSLLTRQNFFPLIVLTPIYFRFHIKTFRPWLYAVILFMLPVLIATALLTVRNSTAAGSLTPFSTGPGLVLFEGNNPNSAGQSAIYPPLIEDCKKDFPPGSDYRHELYRIFARRIAEKPLSVAEVNAYWAGKAKNFIKDHPGYFIEGLLAKVTYFFHSFRRHDIAYLYSREEALQAVLPTVPFALIAILALVGMALSARAWKEHFLIYVILFTQLGVMLSAYVSERQRVAVIALMIFFTAKTVHSLFRDKRIFMVTLLFLTVFFPFLHINGDTAREDIHIAQRGETARILKQEAIQHREKGNLPLASRANALTLAFAPFYPEDCRLAGLRFSGLTIQQEALETAVLFKDPDPSRLFDLATLYIENGMYADAIPIFEYLIGTGFRFNRRFIQSSQPHFHLGRIATLRHDHPTAIAHLHTALAHNPGDPWVLSLLFSLTQDSIYEEKLFRYFDEIDAEFFLGRAHYDTGRYDDAVKRFTYVVQHLPEYRKAKIYHSLALGASGEHGRAGKTYMAAIAQREDDLFSEKQVLDIFDRWSQKEPHSLEAANSLGMVLQAFGQYERAIGIWAKLSERHPPNQVYKDAIRWNQKALRNYGQPYPAP